VSKIKIGIVGLGLAWERLHAPAFEQLNDKFEIAAVCDANDIKARDVAAWLGLPPESAYSDYKNMLKRSDIEAVDTLVPIYENYECAAAVIKSGKHLIAEKPFAASPAAAANLIKLKDKHKVTVLVAENERYAEENILIKQLLDERKIGNPVYFIDNHTVEYQKEITGGGFAQTQWRQHPDFEGGVILDSGVHHIARQRFLFGRVMGLTAHGRPSGVDFSPFSCINALMTFEHYIAGHYSFFMLGKESQAPLVGLRIFGTSGEIYLEEPSCGFVNVSYKDGSREAIQYTPGRGYFHELNNFHAALRLDAKIESTPEKALGDIETVFRIMESTRKPTLSANRRAG
jgi:predicted dehydrogenase